MFAIVLGPGRWKHDHAAVEIDLRPPQSADLLPALASQHQQPNDGAIIIIQQCRGYFPQLGFRQHAVAFRFIVTVRSNRAWRRASA
jgi:hypothetical protein